MIRASYRITSLMRNALKNGKGKGILCFFGLYELWSGFGVVVEVGVPVNNFAGLWLEVNDEVIGTVCIGNNSAALCANCLAGNYFATNFVPLALADGYVGLDRLGGYCIFEYLVVYFSHRVAELLA